MTFKESLATWKISEERICKKIQEKYPMAFIIDGYCKEWDINVPELNVLVEVKQDYKSQQTGNLVVEYEMGKPSGIQTSKADYWVFVTSEEDYIWATPQFIKDYIVFHRPEHKEFIWPGDTKPKKVYLIRKEDFVKKLIDKSKDKKVCNK